jgi:hypothetical protein
MRITGATAPNYLGDEIIMARRRLFGVVGERPSADLMEAPQTIPLPLALAASPSLPWQRRCRLPAVSPSGSSGQSSPSGRPGHRLGHGI